MSHRHFWAEIEYQGAAAGPAQLQDPDVSRNAEKLGLIVSIGSRSSSLGDPR